MMRETTCNRGWGVFVVVGVGAGGRFGEFGGGGGSCGGCVECSPLACLNADEGECS